MTDRLQEAEAEADLVARLKAYRMLINWVLGWVITGAIVWGVWALMGRTAGLVAAVFLGFMGLLHWATNVGILPREES